MTITRKLFDVKRLVLGALLALGVAGVALTALPADHASATEQRNCYPRNFTSDNQCVPH
jgi:hypothetical protein